MWKNTIPWSSCLMQNNMVKFFLSNEQLQENKYQISLFLIDSWVWENSWTMSCEVSWSEVSFTRPVLPCTMGATSPVWLFNSWNVISLKCSINVRNTDFKAIVQKGMENISIIFIMLTCEIVFLTYWVKQNLFYSFLFTFLMWLWENVNVKLHWKLWPRMCVAYAPLVLDSGGP